MRGSELARPFSSSPTWATASTSTRNSPVPAACICIFRMPEIAASCWTTCKSPKCGTCSGRSGSIRSRSTPHGARPVLRKKSLRIWPRWRGCSKPTHEQHWGQTPIFRSSIWNNRLVAFIMKTELRISDYFVLPSDQELMDLLGEKFYQYYNILAKTIASSFNPDVEIWGDGSRRGKYFNGYYVYKKFIEIQLFLDSEFLNCRFLLRKRHRVKIEKHMDILSENTKKRFKEDGFYFRFMNKNDKNDEDFQDAIKVIEILSSTRRRKGTEPA